MVTARKRLISRLEPGRHRTVLRDRGAGFAGRKRAGDDGGLAIIRAADWVLAGPGSPSYALARWRAGPVAGVLRDRVTAGEGVTVLASAAAATAGFGALPVYEIYKAGAAQHWLEGLDLLGLVGIRAAVIPHHDSAEGGANDTRYCYLGERVRRGPATVSPARHHRGHRRPPRRRP